MANASVAADLLVALRLRVLDAYLGGVQRDWAADLLTARRQDLAREAREVHRQDSLRVRGTTPSRPLADFAGRYVDSLHGEITVTLEDGRLVARGGTWVTGDLEHWHYDTFRVTWRDREFDRGRVTFHTGVDGRVTSVEIEDLATFGRASDPAPRR
jgi:hypothetical protein